MNYTEVSIQVAPDFRDIVMAELSQYSYESFVETENGLTAYCPAGTFSEAELQELQERYNEVFPLSYQVQEIAQQNWNEEWEKNFPPLVIGNRVSVRASFHPKPADVQYDIVINPKMSFGTGHHETTTLMLGYQLDIDHNGKDVLDMGCGTGILAIFAGKLGAKSIVGVDIEDWTVENARENAEENNCDLDARLGDVTAIGASETFDIVLANINRNVLLADMARYAQMLRNGGTLLLSGFYEEDVPAIVAEATAQGLTQQEVRNLNRWASVRFEKI